jgi:hypothetical protein
MRMRVEQKLSQLPEGPSRRECHGPLSHILRDCCGNEAVSAEQYCLLALLATWTCYHCDWPILSTRFKWLAVTASEPDYHYYVYSTCHACADV